MCGRIDLDFTQNGDKWVAVSQIIMLLRRPLGKVSIDSQCESENGCKTTTDKEL